VRLAADANVLISAAARHAAFKVVSAPGVEVLTTESALWDASKYGPAVVAKYGSDPEMFARALHSLGTKSVPRVVYHTRLGKAFRRIGARDPDDAELLALAIALRMPLWSNDKDFRRARHTWYTTRQLLAKLGI